MSECECDQETKFDLNIPAGLDALPRQLRSFPDIREALLRGLSAEDKPALREWQARGERDLGVMLLEMWAYVADVLGFYDERIANESYLRTAQRRPSLRRLIELLGYIQTPGIAGTVKVAALAEGRQTVFLPKKTGFRSDAFGEEAPQIFEITEELPIHPYQNEWQIAAFSSNSLPQVTPSEAESSVVGASETRFLVFSPSDFGLAKDRLVLFEIKGQVRLGNRGNATRVRGFRAFEGPDGNDYIEAEFEPPLLMPSGTQTSDVRVLTPTVSASLTQNELVDPITKAADLFRQKVARTETGGTIAFLDGIYRQLEKNAPVVVSGEGGNGVSFLDVGRVESLPDSLVGIPGSAAPTINPNDPPNPLVTLPVSSPTIKPALENVEDTGGSLRRDSLTFHFAFVDAGTVTTVGDPNIAPGALSASNGVPIEGLVTPPPAAVASGRDRLLSQEFLIRDANEVGVNVRGVIRFSPTGRARFQVTDTLGQTMPPLLAPLTVFGNVVQASRGESVFNEVLGSGDPRVANQRFQLRKKPLTYLDSATDPRGYASTLLLRVNGVEWKEVRSFFGCGPEDPVYIVRHTDERETLITFGDGIRGARLPAGVDNVVANYRFGAGEAAPPAGAVEEISRAALGLQGIEGPVAALPGRDPDSPDALRTVAPQSLRTLGRAVSVADFEALALNTTGVLQAKAEYVWIPEEQQAGVSVTFVGDTQLKRIRDRLREQGDPNLAIFVARATALPHSLDVTVEVDSRFEREVVAQEVKEVLTNGKSGILASRNADVGGQFWSSRVYEAALSVDGVLAVQGAVLRPQIGAPISLNQTDVICIPQGSFFDFASGTRVFVDGVQPLGNVVRERRNGGEH